MPDWVEHDSDGLSLKRFHFLFRRYEKKVCSRDSPTTRSTTTRDQAGEKAADAKASPPTGLTRRAGCFLMSRYCLTYDG